MNIARRWLRAAFSRLYKERGIEPMQFDKTDMVHKPVETGEVADIVWDYLQMERDRTESPSTDEGQYEE